MGRHQKGAQPARKKMPAVKPRRGLPPTQKKFLAETRGRGIRIAMTADRLSLAPAVAAHSQNVARRVIKNYLEPMEGQGIRTSARYVLRLSPMDAKRSMPVHRSAEKNGQNVNSAASITQFRPSLAEILIAGKPASVAQSIALPNAGRPCSIRPRGSAKTQHADASSA
jgi:hypothetical protein